MIRDFWMSGRGSFRYLQNTTSLVLSLPGLLLKFAACFDAADGLGGRAREKGDATQIFCCGHYNDDPGCCPS